MSLIQCNWSILCAAAGDAPRLSVQQCLWLFFVGGLLPAALLLAWPVGVFASLLQNSTSKSWSSMRPRQPHSGTLVHFISFSYTTSSRHNSTPKRSDPSPGHPQKSQNIYLCYRGEFAFWKIVHFSDSVSDGYCTLPSSSCSIGKS